MCGSLRASSIDHFLPQANYPEYAIFLPNLFPACECNQGKGKLAIGTALGERFLHPSYDRGMSERSIFVKIRDHQIAPTYHITFKMPKKMKCPEAFAYHAQKVLKEDRLIYYVRDKFESFCRRPSLLCSELRFNPVNKAKLREILYANLKDKNIDHQTKNNWESIVLHAILEKRTLNWVWRRLADPGRAANAPLIAL